MRRTRALAITAVALVVALAGCSVRHRSGDFACETQADCRSNRTCIDGYCVAPQPTDGGVVVPDAAACPAQCTSCNLGAKSCKIDCVLDPELCARQITCPAGWSCDLSCSTRLACSSGVDCSNSTSCTITCGGTQSCRGITCGPGPCDIDCAGIDTCRSVDCGTSCACDVSCHASSLCTAVTCTSIDCFSPSIYGGCTSEDLGCNTCP